MLFSGRVYVSAICPMLYTGPGCKFRCRCRDSDCPPDGACAACQMGYFGPYCQYVDANYSSILSDAARILKDADVSSCLSGRKTLKEVALTFSRAYMTFVSLVYNEMAAEGKDVSLDTSVNFKLDKTPTDGCNLTRKHFAYGQVYYHCMRPVIATEIVFKGTDVHTLCEVYVSLGRNLAVGEFSFASVSESVHGDYLRQANDGDPETAFTTQHQISPRYHFEAYDGKLESIMNISFTAQGDSTTCLLNRRPDTPIELVSLKSEGYSSISISELEARGDCPLGTHGLDCSKSCSQNCSLNMCTLEGNCILCYEGYYGLLCDQECSNCTGVCEQETGKCLTNCSENCAEDGSCEMVSGNCTHGCEPGFFGIDCHKDCSEYCDQDGSCYRETGHCYFGCFIGYFGYQCTQQCNENCDQDGSCERENGDCLFGCRVGYFGPDCTKTGLPDNSSTWTCHCKDGHCQDETDVCPEDKCVRGWFAYSCHYRDQGVYGKMSSDLLSDNNATTCYTPPGNRLTVTWSEYRPVSWVRLVFDAKAVVSNFHLYYTGRNKAWYCRHPTVVSASDDGVTYDLDCGLQISVSKFVVSWDGHGAVCTFNLCGVPSVNDSILRLIFLSHKRKITYRKTFPLLKHELIHKVKVGNFSFSSLQLDIVSGQAEICEVELLGVVLEPFAGLIPGDLGHLYCVSTSYGLTCDGICSIACWRNRCRFDGRCISCVQGRSGHFCREGENFMVNQGPVNTTISKLRAQESKSHDSRGEFGFWGILLVVVSPTLCCIACWVIDVRWLTISIDVSGKCPQLYTGPDCRFSCRCLKECNETTECDECQLGYFGPSCQYSDTVYLGNFTDQTQRLKDNNRTSCFTSETRQQEVTFEVTLTYLSFVSVYFNKTSVDGQENGLNVSLELYLRSSSTVNQVHRTCRVTRIYTASGHVSFYCLHAVQVTDVVLKGPDVYRLCEVYISL
ncbi:hypothetical protein Btru_010881, partial [Bulinus truncatus]